MKMTRQEILDQDDGPRLWAIIDESALHRVVGSPALMRRQCEHLLRMRKHPRVVIQVIPDTAGHLRGSALADEKSVELIGVILNGHH